ncbi:Putative succinyl-CoA transferase [Corynebacterium kalinowskii]|uniref:Succinyl-CoA transferase n=1 Tax=Corynebacterium kalinowskii TaxID=2675216 RepID=A0A6B8VQX7_9CORY|nr:GNAT family protein [Corynebacterium kalinowskii]QGU01166.1 Putative succinyl-CoA transferase [Corynebacterium kalinowskii]
MTSEIKYPPFGLQLFDGHVLLRVIEDCDLKHLCAVTVSDIFEPNCPWEFPWLSQENTALSTAQFHWGLRASNKPENWVLPFAAYVDDTYVGTIDMRASDFREKRSISTGSYVLRRAQGQGIGTRMRAMVAAYAFDFLSAKEMRTAWHPMNKASGGVSAALGYQVVGRAEFGAHDRPEVHARLVAEDFLGCPTLTVSGHTEALREFLDA